MAGPSPGGAPRGPFAFAQLEFGFPLGPDDGHYLIRETPKAPPERILAVSKFESVRRSSRADRRRPRTSQAAEPISVPVSRVTVIKAEPFADEAAAGAWLEGLRRHRGALSHEVGDALVAVNRMLRVHRATAADPYAGEISEKHTLARRVGYGEGHEVAEGRFGRAVEVPQAEPRRTRRGERHSPQERLAAVLGGRASVLACEELVLRARLDINGQRYREAALQARVALETMLSELGTEATVGTALAAVRECRDSIVEAANTALDHELGEPRRRAVNSAVERMEAVLARRRAG